MNPKILEAIGLTEGETKVYFALVKLGSVTTGPIAEESDVSTSKVYPILERLEKKGLVGHIIKEQTKHFHALNPNRLLDYIDQEKEELEKKRGEIETIIPQIQTLMSSPEKKPEAFILEGFKAVTNLVLTVLDDLQPEEEYLVFGANYGKVPGLREFFHKYHNKRAEKNIKLKMLANADTKSTLEKPTYKKAEIKFLPNSLITNMQIAIYKDKSLIIIWRKSPIAFVLENEEATKSFKGYFEAFWKIAKK